MRVLQVTQRYFPYMGGIETHVYEVARRMAADGVDVTVLSTDLSGELPKSDIIENVSVVRVPAYPRKRDYYFAPQIFSKIRNGNWDIVHCQGYHTFVPPLAMMAAKSTRIPYVLTFHSGGHSSSMRHSVRDVQTRILRPLLKGAGKLIGVSQFEAELFKNRLGFSDERFYVVPNGAQLPAIDFHEAEKSSQKIVLSVGRLEKYKGHHRLIEAFPQVLEKCRQAHLKILGKGTYEQNLRELVSRLGLDEHVTITFVPPEKRSGIAMELHNAALVVLFSEYEAHPVAVMEAAAMNCSILVADTSGLSEIASQGLARAIPIVSTSSQIAAAMLEMLENPFQPADFELPTWEACTARLLEIYSEVIHEAAL